MLLKKPQGIYLFQHCKCGGWVELLFGYGGYGVVRSFTTMKIDYEKYDNNEIFECCIYVVCYECLYMQHLHLL